MTGLSGRSPNRRHERQYFYKYVSAATAKRVLTTRQLRWSSPLLFNDPFDVTQELRLNFDEAELNEALAEELAELIGSGGSVPDTAPPALKLLTAWLATVSPTQREQIARGLLQEPSSPTQGQIQALAALKQVWREIVPGLRVLCLSEVNDVTLMWSHYADGHRGAVLRFEALDELDGAWLLARPVVYQAGAPAIADKREWARCLLRKGESTYRDLFTEVQYVKTPDWKYEREWRIVTFAGLENSEQFSQWGFNPRELTAVYLGTRCSDSDHAEILALLLGGLEHVTIFRAHPAPVGAYTFKAIPR